MSATEQTANRIGGFRILDSVPGGEGAEGTVWRVICEEPTVEGVAVGEIVALKSMPVTGDGYNAYRVLKRRTDRLVTINHPNVVRYRGCFRLAEAFNTLQAVVMDWLDGETLKSRIACSPGGMDADEALTICEQAVAGFAAAAAAGITHRDIKPSNIFICRDGTVKVIDFELAHAVGGTLSDASGRFLGTFNYMAPEFMVASFHGNEASDVFSMGVVLHEALTGHLPYAAGGRANQPDFDFLDRWSDASKRDAALRISDRATKLLPGLESVLPKMLDPDGQRRFQSFASVQTALAGVSFTEFKNGENQYRLVKIVGKGGFGEVTKARMLPDGRLVAVKHLHDQRSGDRFRREARLMQQLHDEYFTQFIDYFETLENGATNAYLVMDFLPDMPGSSLRDAIRRACSTNVRLEPREVIAAFVRYLKGLAIMHEQQIYHRDIKPANLYYPHGHPERAVIMDMGIARNAAGTLSTGQVPGTLDYMPPEIVLDANCRGDAKMDIYALGLSLYEALTGKLGYARLSSDTSGLKAFYARAKSKRPPDFSADEIVCRPQLYELLKRMSTPVYRDRLGDANEVAEMLQAIDWDHVVERSSDTLFVSPERTSSPEPETSPDTQHSDRPMRPRRRLARRQVLWGVAVPAAILVVALLLAKPVLNWWNVRQRLETDRLLWQQNADVARGGVAEIEKAFATDYENGRKQADEWSARWLSDKKGERLLDDGCIAECTNRIAVARIGSLATIARHETEPIVCSYALALSPDGVDERFADWKRTWNERLRPLARQRYDEILAIVDEARTACVRRMFGRLGQAEREADAVIGQYENHSLSNGIALAESWRTKWTTNGIPQAKLAHYESEFTRLRGVCEQWRQQQSTLAAARSEREARIRKLLRQAREDACRLIADYGDDTKMGSAVAREYAQWQKDYLAELGGEPEFTLMRGDIEQAGKERQLRMKELRVVTECRATLANIWSSINAKNVRNWRNDYLDYAETALQKADAAGKVSSASRATLEREIETCRSWCVGVVVNKTGMTLTLLGTEISPDAGKNEVPFVFTNAIPEGAAITAVGYEPIRVDARRFDSKATVVSFSSLRRSLGESTIRIPPLPDGVVCIVDGTVYPSGVVKVADGRHEVTFRRLESVGGVRRYGDVTMSVEAKASGAVDVEVPSTWSHNPESDVAAKRAALSERGAKIYDECQRGLELMPVDTRRRRLEKVHEILSHYLTPEALGDRQFKELKSRYQVETDKAVGYVFNAMDVDAVVSVYERQVVVKPGEKALVIYDHGHADGMPTGAYVALHGYESVRMPSVERFDGQTFTLARDVLTPLPVSVTPPALEDGVRCYVDGKLLSGRTELRPGSYRCVYARDGYADQRLSVEVKIGKAMTLPAPAAWQKIGMFGQLMDSVRDVTESTGRGFKSAADTLGTIERKTDRTDRK